MQGQKQKMVTIDWKPNRESKEPIYAQIVSYVSRRISSGVASPPATIRSAFPAQAFGDLWRESQHHRRGDG